MCAYIHMYFMCLYVACTRLIRVSSSGSISLLHVISNLYFKCNPEKLLDHGRMCVVRIGESR